MPRHTFKPRKSEVKNFVLASLVTGAAFAAYYHEYTWEAAAFYVAASAGIILTRELGFRTVAQWMDAYVDFEFSRPGSMVTLFTAVVAVASSLPIIMLFPVYAVFSNELYEHWGKSIDSIWMKRNFWLFLSGVLMLLAGFAVTYSTGAVKLAQMYALFAIFQLLPFDYSGIPTGPLDGAYILRWSGFVWLIMMGVAVIGFVLTL